MADSDRSEARSSSSSSHKRPYDALRPDGGIDRSNDYGVGRSNVLSSASSHSSPEGSRERSKRARNDLSDSSYASEVDDLLLSGDSVSPSGSSSSQSSYHSALSVLPSSSSTHSNNAVEDDVMLVDPVLPEPIDPSSTVQPSFPLFLDILSDVPSTSSSPTRRSSAYPTASITNSSPGAGSHATADDTFSRSLERATVFDREIAPLRLSPVDIPPPAFRSNSFLSPPEISPELDDDFRITGLYSPGNYDDAANHNEEQQHHHAIRTSAIDSLARERLNDFPPRRSAFEQIFRHSPLLNPHEAVGGADNIPAILAELDMPEAETRQDARRQLLRMLYADADLAYPPAISGSLESNRLTPLSMGRTSPHLHASSSRPQSSYFNLPAPPSYDDSPPAPQAPHRNGRSYQSRPPRSPMGATPANAGDTTEGTESSFLRLPIYEFGLPQAPRRPTSRTSTYTAAAPSLSYSDYRNRAHDSRARHVTREPEARERRLAALLTGQLPDSPTLPAQSTPAPHVPTSSYSTLRHALDDNSVLGSNRGVQPIHDPFHPASVATRRDQFLNDSYLDLSDAIIRPMQGISEHMPPRKAPALLFPVSHHRRGRPHDPHPSVLGSPLGWTATYNLDMWSLP
ncbi:hypothetical protein GY45DRAFT_217660 [Cubamyces sp. BRFM 1775]|nr:hypothetical protein GY45DRAFT_217660 [Cubamyces sp. BRFM 1775]